MKLTYRQDAFLRNLKAAGGEARNKDLPCAFRDEDRARQACRRLGLAVYGATKKIAVNHWYLTPAGKKAVSEPFEVSI